MKQRIKHKLVIQKKLLAKMPEQLQPLRQSSFSISDSAHSSDFRYIMPEQRIITQILGSNKELRIITEGIIQLEEDLNTIIENITILSSNQIVIEKTSARQMMMAH